MSNPFKDGRIPLIHDPEKGNTWTGELYSSATGMKARPMSARTIITTYTDSANVEHHLVQTDDRITEVSAADAEPRKTSCYIVISAVNPSLILCTDGQFHTRCLVCPDGYSVKFYKRESAAKKHNPWCIIQNVVVVL